MKAVLTPAISLMNRLKYPQKFMLVGLLLVLPLAVVLYQFLVQINKDIDFNSKEILGAEYNAPLVEVLQSVQIHRGLSSAILNGDTTYGSELSAIQSQISTQISAVDEVDRRLGTTLLTTQEWSGIKQTWDTLKREVLTLTPQDSFERHTALLSDILNLITVSGNNSNLILDPDLDTYYLMDNVITKLPQASEYLGQMRAIGLQALSKGELTSEDSTRLVILSGLVRTTVATTIQGFDYAYGWNPEMRTQFEGQVDAYVKTVNDFLAYVNDKLIMPGTSILQLSDYYTVATGAVDSAFTLYDASSSRLTELIQVRVDNWLTRRSLVIIFTIVALGLAAYLLVGFYQSVRRVLLALEQASQRMVGGQTAELVLENRDELAQIAISFNHIAQEIVSARDRALEANKAKSVFLANMSHELRTPLNAVIGYSELIEEECEEIGQTGFVPDLKKIQSSARHLLQLINGILDLSKIEAGKMDLHLEDVGVKLMVNDVISIINPLLEKNGNRLIVEGTEPDIKMHTDLTKLRQVLFNLLSNASKFTSNGQITLAVERTANDQVCFRITDTGIGIKPEHMNKLFREFSQADSSTTRKYGGTGLGLAITKRFCEMLGGSIAVESEYGKGSIFIVYLPLVTAKPDAPAGSATATREAGSETRLQPVNGKVNGKLSGNGNGRGKSLGTVLVIDDDATVHDLMQRFLSKEGYHVESASNAEDGLIKARELHPDVITLDVMMPGTDGWTVLTQLKADAQLAKIPVVMMTMLGDQSLGYSLGAADFLTKPIEREQLVGVLRKFRNGGSATALVVEDDEKTRLMLARMVEKEGWIVTEADNGRTALERMRFYNPDIILLDLMMPEMNGFQFLNELRRNPRWRSIPVVVITAIDLSNEDREQLSQQVQQIVQKGAYSRDQLLSEVRELVSARAPIKN
ncbi:MAG: response regulator [Anaerolineae bacterium]|nr:response regulator [Anaerolineae bacterium]